MAQTYTLDEAAHKLGLPLEEFKRKIKADWKTLKSFRDGPTLRFRAADIDELARSLGQASDPGLQPGDAYPMDSSDEISLGTPPPSSKPRRPAADKPLSLDDSDEDFLLLPGADSGVSKKKPRTSGDSDVRLDMTPSRKDVGEKGPTEEIVLDLSGPRSGILKPPSSIRTKSGRLKGPDSSKIPGPSSKPASDDSSSEFELSLDSDSDSFELQLNTESSEEVDLGAPMPPSGGRAGQSGINLRKPADSGVSLEKTPEADSDIDFELTLDAPAAASGRLGIPKSGGRAEADSDSEFELSLEDNSGITDSLAEDLDAEDDKGDIFETDFELPIVADDESGSEVVAIDSSDTDLENSDFDIAISDEDAPLEDESASQVMLVDDEPELLADEDAAPVRKGRKKRPVLGGDDVLLDDIETDEGASASAAMRSSARRGEDDIPVRTVVAKPATWGPLPALVLLPCMVVVLIGGLMSFEVLRGMWGYQQPNKPSDALVRGVADTFGMKVSE